MVKATYNFVTLILLSFFILNSKYSNAQILSYTTDTSGALNMVSPNASGVSLSRVNGAVEPSSPCTTGGFSSNNFPITTIYSTSLPAVQASVTANSGYNLNVTGFSVDLRRSTTGPANVRYAYSIDGGSTWIDQGIDQYPNNSVCGSTITATWITSFTVSPLNPLIFRIFGCNASGTTGTFQVMNLIINGTVSSSSGCTTPTGLSASLITTTSATLNWTAVTGAVSYNVQYRPVGSSTWFTTTSTSITVALSGLTCATNYEFQVQTVCTSGTSSYSSSSTFVTLACSTGSGSSGKIAIYFNTPVDTTASTGVSAKYLHNAMADTLIAYINRAHYTIDIAQYDYNQSSGFANVATAINNAYAAGKKIRWIYDGSQSNTGLGLLNTAIPTLGSPTTSSYNIMHNKFVIIDAHSTNPNDAIVCTGSEDWGVTQFNYSNNNILFIQDSALANAYTSEFNMMWGDTGMIPNTTLSKFGPFKTDLGRHTFNIGGKTVELYFSPSDNTDAHIQSSINTANTDLYFGVYTFTRINDANAIATKNSAGVYTAGIVDQYSSTTGSAYPILTGSLGANLKTYSASFYVYHNKMLIVDPSNSCSDPLVLTGSHNWTTAATTQNDENTIIIHSDTIANIYYQAFKGNFSALGGTLTPISPCIPTSCSTPTGITVTSITTTSALVSWTAVTGATSYNIQYRISGALTWSSTTSTSTSVSLTGLSSGTVYEVQVQAVCASLSTFSASSVFTTLGPPINVYNVIEDCNTFNVVPNPVTENITFTYHLSLGNNVCISVYNIIGQEVVRIVNNEYQKEGNYIYNTSLPAKGIYFVKFIIGNYSINKKIEKI